MSFGIRKILVCDSDREGVIPVTLTPQNEEETANVTIIHNGMDRNRLKFPEPSLVDLPEEPKLNTIMSTFLKKNMVVDLMTNELNEYWFDEIEGADTVE